MDLFATANHQNTVDSFHQQQLQQMHQQQQMHQHHHIGRNASPVDMAEAARRSAKFDAEFEAAQAAIRNTEIGGIETLEAFRAKAKAKQVAFAADWGDDPLAGVESLDDVRAYFANK